MDRKLLERLIGAGVLVIALVVIVPAILDGEREDESETGDKTALSATSNELRRTHTIRLDRSAQSPPVAREVTRPAATSGGTDNAGSGGSNETAKSSLTPTVKPETKSAVARSKARETPKPAPDPTPVETVAISKAGWTVQLGSFSSRKNAQQLADKVGADGLPVFLMTIDRSGKKLYRVRVGPWESRAKASEVAERLKKAGYAGQVTQ
jgi:cell division septation protein DedD